MVNDLSTTEKVEMLKKEIENYEFLATTLPYEHQESVRNALLRKADNLKYQLNELLKKQ